MFTKLMIIFDHRPVWKHVYKDSANFYLFN